MTTFLHRRSARWLVALLAAVLLGAAGSIAGVLAASARGGLPHRSAAQLLVDVQKARVTGLSGTVVQNSDLGLPSLPGVGGNGSSDLTSLVTGSHTLRVWYAGPQHARVALLGSLGESDVIRNGSDVWVWRSRDKSALHRSVPAGEAGHNPSLMPPSPMTPQQAADAALKALSPTTKVSTDRTAVVAGRSAYELVLQPRGTGSLIGSVHIAVDGSTHVPTRVQVFARNATKPSFEVGFVSFNPTKPALSVFRFNPPPGTKVTEAPAGPGTQPHVGMPDGGKALAGSRPAVVGTGWTSVVRGSVPASATGSAGSLTRMLDSLPRVTGSWGSGHLLRGSLFSAVLTDDGRFAAGAVPPQELYAVLGR
jgi:outer membrane lipoprotein-sorting protein